MLSVLVSVDAWWMVIIFATTAIPTAFLHRSCRMRIYNLSADDGTIRRGIDDMRIYFMMYSTAGISTCIYSYSSFPACWYE